ncbi:MAG: hypothetical protein JO199_09520, partial [Candidatus Eremiobacteraeota bacterium]|nr:hypothetical protein [Candidatus Eremiobacteraeota bacterium]
MAWASLASSPADARTRLDARIDALTPSQLLTRNAVALVDPGRQRRARALADLRHFASAGWGLSQILAYWWLWRSGTGARIRDSMRRRSRSRTFVRAVFGAILGALGPVASLPFAAMSYRVGYGTGLTNQTFGGWFLDYCVRVAVDALLGAVIVAGVLWLVDRVRVWYLIVAAVLYAGAFGAVMLEPVSPFGPAHKLTPRNVVAINARVSQAVGVPGAPVVVVATSHRTNAISLRAGGIGLTSRVVMGDVALLHFTDPETAVALAHGDAHVRFEDPMR